MGEARAEYEGEIFRRLESRLVAVEIKADGNAARLSKLEPIVGDLRDRNLLADAIADRVKEHGRHVVTKVTVACAIAAVLVPPVLTALLVKWLTH